MTHVGDPAGATHIQRATRVRIILGGILAAFLAALDTTVVATVMPTIVKDLGSLDLYSWVFSIYMIMSAVSMPVWGKLSDEYGRRKLFFAAVGLFLLGSMLCGAAQDMSQLILFRGLQGIAAGGLSSVPFALVSSVFPHAERGKALGILASAWGVSSILGPLVGSTIVMSLHWRWVFFINMPIGLAAVAVIALAYRERESVHRETIDYAGAVLLCGAILTLLMALMRTGRGPIVLNWEAALLMTACLAFLLFFIRRERVARSPILALEFFQRRGFWVGNLLGFLASFAMYGVIAYLPLYVQMTMGGTPMQAGLVITPMSLSWSTASVTAGRLAHRVGEQRMIRFGLLMMVLGFFLAHFTTPDSSVWYLVLCVSIIGIGMGSQTPTLMLVVQHSVDQRNMGVATSTQMLSRMIGGAVGVSIMGSALTASMVAQIYKTFPAGARRFPTDPQRLLEPANASQLLPEQLRLVLNAFSEAMHSMFTIAIIVLVTALLFTFLFPPAFAHNQPARPESGRPPRS